MTYEQILKKLKSMTNEKNRAGMSRFGIETSKAYGISIYDLRKLAKEIPKDHDLALKLWESDIHEARHLASQIDEPGKVTEDQIEKWVKDFNSWDICDQVCDNLFMHTRFAYPKIYEWAEREEEFVKRASFTLIACLSWHDKNATDQDFIRMFPLIKKASTDERNFVRKAVNWALRNIGKRNLNLNKEAVKLARELEKMDSKSARWIAKDAIRELTSEKMQERLKTKDKGK